MLVIRLQRTGRRNAPTFRMVVAEHTMPIKGRVKEIVGHYLPTREPIELTVDEERITHWISYGATPSDTVARLLTNNGMKGLEKFMKKYTKKAKKVKGESAEDGGEAPAPKAAPEGDAPAEEAAPTEEKKGDAPVEEEKKKEEAPVEEKPEEPQDAPETPAEEPTEEPEQPKEEEKKPEEEQKEAEKPTEETAPAEEKPASDEGDNEKKE